MPKKKKKNSNYKPESAFKFNKSAPIREGEMRMEEWCGHEIRFIDLNGEWYAILKDICDALGLRTNDIAQRLHPNMLERVRVKVSDTVSNGIRYENVTEETSDTSSNGVRSPGDNEHRWMLAVNEVGIYEALFASRKLEARKFRLWSFEVLKKLRSSVGLKGYEVMRMTEASVQDEIDCVLDSLFYDEETGKVMTSITVQGGDVEIVPFEET